MPPRSDEVEPIRESTSAGAEAVPALRLCLLRVGELMVGAEPVEQRLEELKVGLLDRCQR
jgi:hypothetical protein